MHSPAKPDARYLTSTDGTVIYAEAIGDPSKTHLVFVHGFSFSTIVFDCIFLNPHYAEKFYLVRFDTRGHGRSGKPRNAEAYASQRFAQDFAAVEEAFQLTQPVLVGWSLGTSILIDIAARLPLDTLSGAVFLCPMPYIGDITPRIASATALEIAESLQHTDDVALAAAAKVALVDACFAQPDQIPHELKCYWAGAALAATPADITLMMNRPQDLAPMLKMGKHGSLPLLLVQGDADALITAEKVIPEIQTMWPDADVVVFEGVGHSPFYEDTERTMKCIGDFIGDIRTQRCVAKL